MRLWSSLNHDWFSVDSTRSYVRCAGAARVADGVQLLAGGLEALLQRLRVTVHRIAVRIELSAPSAEADEDTREARAEESGVLLRLSAEEVVYSGDLPSPLYEAPKQASSNGNSVLQKTVTFSGLKVDLERLSASPKPSAAAAAQIRSEPGPVEFDHSRNERLSGADPCNSSSSNGSGSGSVGGGNTVVSGADGRGLEGRLQLHLTCGSTVARTVPRAAAHLTLQLVCMQLCQPQLALVVEACTSFAATLPANHCANGQMLPATAERYAQTDWPCI